MVLGAQPTRELLPLDGGGIQVGVNGGRFEEGLRQSPPSHPSPTKGGRGLQLARAYRLRSAHHAKILESSPCGS
jgi:hypothetical protein